MPPPRAVLFDFDGVIADTENVHVAAWQTTLARINLNVSDDVAARAAEIDDRVWVAEMFAKRKIVEVDVDGWCREKQKLTVELLSESPVVYPGAVELVRALQACARLGIVSTTWRANVEAVLRFAGLADAFEFIVGKEDVAAVKPDPEGYARALGRLGLSADDVVAIEDSPGGIAAATGAGLRVLAVGHRRPDGDWRDAAFDFVPSLAPIEPTKAALGFTASTGV